MEARLQKCLGMIDRYRGTTRTVHLTIRQLLNELKHAATCKMNELMNSITIQFDLILIAYRNKNNKDKS